MDPRNSARSLLSLAAQAKAEPIEIEVDRVSLLKIEYLLHAQDFDISQRYFGPAEEMLNELQAALASEDWVPETLATPKPERNQWKFGTAMSIRTTPLPIHLGFLQPLRWVPLLPSVPDSVALYLITVDNGVDYLKRENHDVFGWHYHYLNRQKVRSDVVLCWDTRWNAPVPQSMPPARRGLFVEKHAENGKEFIAKPFKWGSKKRNTMYDVCLADLKARQITQYRCAADKSEPVYPLDAKLTPHSAVSATSLKHAIKGKRKAKKKGR